MGRQFDTQGTAATSPFARFLIDPPSIEAVTRERARKVIADTFAAMLAGAASEVAHPLLEYADAMNGLGGNYVIAGTSRRANAEYAALINGTFAAALEFDDVLSMMPGHPSAVVVSALAASDAALAADGERLTDAYIIGIETGARLAQAMTLAHYKRGFHATGTLAQFSALGALAYAEQLDAAQIDHAIGIACSLSSGIQGNFGTMTKSLHSGLAARNALTAVQLAKAGFTSRKSIFEVEGGYFDTYGTEDSSLSHIEGKFGAPWIVDSPRITQKLFPCCYATHRGIDAVRQIRRETGIAANDVEHVICLVPPGGLVPLKFSWPQSRFEALFSMQYAIAVALLHEHPTLASFSEETVKSTAVGELRPRIVAQEDSECVARDPEFDSRSYGTRGEVMVRIETKDSRVFQKTVEIAPGHPERELTWDQLGAKFADCAGSAALGESQSAATFEALRHLDKSTSFGAIVSCMQTLEKTQ